MRYQEYLKSLEMTYLKAYGNCEPVCRKMKDKFPELKLIRGHYYCDGWGKRMHWWLLSSDGKIIDPTAIQFPSNGTGAYELWDESHPEPTGMCPNCGDYVFDSRTVHPECEGAFIASLYE